jgi:hypothetical protein
LNNRINLKFENWELSCKILKIFNVGGEGGPVHVRALQYSTKHGKTFAQLPQSIFMLLYKVKQLVLAV